MTVTIRKRSPRAPSLPLDEALARAIKVYSIEGKHPAPVDVVARHLGYTSASNGSAASAIASIRYFGLCDRPGDGLISIHKDVEAYQFAPNDSIRTTLLQKWVRTPQVFADLLQKYQGSLPSAATLKFDLLQQGFSPSAADECVTCFLKSVEFSKIYTAVSESAQAGQEATSESDDTDEEDSQNNQAPTSEIQSAQAAPKTTAGNIGPIEFGSDQIPVRLSGGRKAWIVVPSPLYDADKKRLYAQIELLLTDDAIE